MGDPNIESEIEADLTKYNLDFSDYHKRIQLARKLIDSIALNTDSEGPRDLSSTDQPFIITDNIAEQKESLLEIGLLYGSRKLDLDKLIELIQTIESSVPENLS